MTQVDTQQVQALLTFWQQNSDNWFVKSATFDQQFKQQFAELHWLAAARELEHWVASNEGALALLLLLDQYPRNCFRHTGHMYATDGLARHYATILTDRLGDMQLPVDVRVFCYLPFTHSEDLADQDKAVVLNERGQTGEGLKFALHHRSIVQEYGRFPHRNQILGRRSSESERHFLATGGFKG